jgi:DNA-binding NtrC family response regulator
MFVDDEEGVRLGYDRYFTVHGFDVETAGDGEKAVSRLRENPADVVVADLKMPGMDGIQLLEWIHGEQPDTKFILLTGFGTKEVEERARALGAFEYLNKPIAPDTLAAVVTAATILGAPRTPGETAEVVEAVQAAAPSTDVDVQEDELEATVEVATDGAVRRTLEIVFALVGAPILGLAFVVFLPIIGFGALFWMLGRAVTERLEKQAG